MLPTSTAGTFEHPPDQTWLVNWRRKRADMPVLVLTRDPVADRIESGVVAALTRASRGLVSALMLTRDDGVPTECVVNFDDIHTLPREAFRRPVAQLKPVRLAQSCAALRDAMGR